MLLSKMIDQINCETLTYAYTKLFHYIFIGLQGL